MSEPIQPIKIDRAYLLVGNKSLKEQLAECDRVIKEVMQKREQILGALAYNEALISTQPE